MPLIQDYKLVPCTSSKSCRRRGTRVPVSVAFVLAKLRIPHSFGQDAEDLPDDADAEATVAAEAEAANTLGSTSLWSLVQL